MCECSQRRLASKLCKNCSLWRSLFHDLAGNYLGKLLVIQAVSVSVMMMVILCGQSTAYGCQCATTCRFVCWAMTRQQAAWCWWMWEGCFQTGELCRLYLLKDRLFELRQSALGILQIWQRNMWKGFAAFRNMNLFSVFCMRTQQGNWYRNRHRKVK